MIYGRENPEDASSGDRRITTLRRFQSIAVPTNGVIWLCAMLTVSALPLLSIVLAVLNGGLLWSIFSADRRIIELGGLSFWKDKWKRDS